MGIMVVEERRGVKDEATTGIGAEVRLPVNIDSDLSVFAEDPELSVRGMNENLAPPDSAEILRASARRASFHLPEGFDQIIYLFAFFNEFFYTRLLGINYFLRRFIHETEVSKFSAYDSKFLVYF